MIDEKGLDSKVVVSPLGRDGRPRYPLTDEDRYRIGDYFKRYKLHEPGKLSKVPGWDSAENGLAYVNTTHAFFLRCRDKAGAECACRQRNRSTQLILTMDRASPDIVRSE